MCVSHTLHKDTLLDTTLLVFGHLSGSRVGRSRVLWTDLTVFDFVFVFVFVIYRYRFGLVLVFVIV